MLRALEQSIKHYRTDAYLLSFPKCGRTWLRLMLAKAIENHFGVTIDNSLRLHAYANRRLGIPRIRVTHDWKEPATQVLSRDKSRFRDKRIVLLVRDPRDVVVSQYFHRTRRKRNYAGELEDFVRTGRASLTDLVGYYNVWAEFRNSVRGFLLVSYEDLQSDAAHELARVVDFVGIEGVSRTAIEQAVEYCRFDRMHRMERDHQFESSRLHPKDVSDPLSYKTRSGKIGGYRDHFSEELAAWVDEYIRENLHPDYGRYFPPAADKRENARG